MAYQLYSRDFQLDTSTTALDLGLGANEVLVVSSATVVNADSTSRLLTMNLATDGGPAGATNFIEYKKALSINQSTNTALSGKNVTPGAALYAYIDSNNTCILSISGTIIPQAA